MPTLHVLDESPNAMAPCLKERPWNGHGLARRPPFLAGRPTKRAIGVAAGSSERVLPPNRPSIDKKSSFGTSTVSSGFSHLGKLRQPIGRRLAPRLNRFQPPGVFPDQLGKFCPKRRFFVNRSGFLRKKPRKGPMHDEYRHQPKPCPLPRGTLKSSTAAALRTRPPSTSETPRSRSGRFQPREEADKKRAAVPGTAALRRPFGPVARRASRLSL